MAVLDARQAALPNCLCGKILPLGEARDIGDNAFHMFAYLGVVLFILESDGDVAAQIFEEYWSCQREPRSWASSWCFPQAKRGHLPYP
jgi:hypothetical protein